MNRYKLIIIEGEECVQFVTEGKYNVEVLVDKNIWFDFLCKYSWTVVKQGNRCTVKTSINKQSQNIYRVIVENIYDELDWFGATVDHINNNALDNRKKNLRLYCNSLLNSTNISSKNGKEMQYIYPQKRGERIYGYKVHFNLGGETTYKNFTNLGEAKIYRDRMVETLRIEKYKLLVKKCRDIEFERGLRDKLSHGEKDEVIKILSKYSIIPE